MTNEEMLKAAVVEASERAEVREAVGRVYAELQREIDARRPICVVSGRCCRFEEYGHRLYVTTMELATFVDGLRRVGTARHPPQTVGTAHPLTQLVGSAHPTGATGWDGAGCPFQENKLCGVHSIRPFGCRMFFCDATAAEWQNEQYERFHSELKRLHERLEVPYYYVEWREGLQAILA